MIVLHNESKQINRIDSHYYNYLFGVFLMKFNIYILYVTDLNLLLILIQETYLIQLQMYFEYYNYGPHFRFNTNMYSLKFLIKQVHYTFFAELLIILTEKY